MTADAESDNRPCVAGVKEKVPPLPLRFFAPVVSALPARTAVAARTAPPEPPTCAALVILTMSLAHYRISATYHRTVGIPQPALRDSWHSSLRLRSEDASGICGLRGAGRTNRQRQGVIPRSCALRVVLADESYGTCSGPLSEDQGCLNRRSYRCFLIGGWASERHGWNVNE